MKKHHYGDNRRCVAVFKRTDDVKLFHFYAFDSYLAADRFMKKYFPLYDYEIKSLCKGMPIVRRSHW